MTESMDDTFRKTTAGLCALASAQLRYEVLAALHHALEQSELSQAALARLLGVRRSAVNQVFRGDGNLRISTLAEYLAAMGWGLQLDLVPNGQQGRLRAEEPGGVAPTDQPEPQRRAAAGTPVPNQARYRQLTRTRPRITQENPTWQLAGVKYTPVPTPESRTR